MPLTRRCLLAGLSCAALGGCEAAGVVPRPGAPGPGRGEAWMEALGPLDDVPAGSRGAFTETFGFAPLPPSRPDGWRVVRPEPPQTVAEFRASRPHRRAAPRERLGLLPLGHFPVDILFGDEFVGIVRSPPLADVAAVLAAFFATPTTLLPAMPVPGDIGGRAVQGHRQYDARALLAAIAPRLPEDAYGLLAMTTVDLFVTAEQQYTFGWSTFHERLGVVSFTRFDPSFFGGLAPEDIVATMLARGLRVAVHEVGHMFGMGHCQAFRCIMNGIAHLDELDETPLQLCPVCLRKLHLVTGLDPHARDRALLGEFERLGLADEARWLRERIGRLTAPRRVVGHESASDRFDAKLVGPPRG
jgi:archaemetzincin